MHVINTETVETVECSAVTISVVTIVTIVYVVTASCQVVQSNTPEVWQVLCISCSKLSEDQFPNMFLNDTKQCLDQQCTFQIWSSLLGPVSAGAGCRYGGGGGFVD